MARTNIVTVWPGFKMIGSISLPFCKINLQIASGQLGRITLDAGSDALIDGEGTVTEA
jgi:hypothetical protein